MSSISPSRTGGFNPGRFLLSNGFYVVFTLLVIFYSVASDAFLSASNLRNILVDSAALIVACTGLSFVVLTGSLDLSIGSVGFVTAVISGSLILAGQPLIVAFLVAILIGLALGAFNGALIAYLKLNPLIVTLGMMIALRGVGLTISRGWQIYLPDGYRELASGLIGPVPRLVVVAIIVLLLGHFIVRRTRFGRFVVAVGCHARSAQRVGINVTRLQFLVFVVSGVAAAIGGIVAMSNMGVLQPQQGRGLEFTAVAAIVMGGTSLFGGRGSLIPGTLMGVLMLTIIENGLAILGASPFVYPLVRGVVIFTAMYADALKSSRIARV